MLKEHKKSLIITSIITLLPMLIGIILWNRLPEVMATHFSLNGESNGFSSKAFTVLGLPAIFLAIHLLCAFVSAHDPKKKNISSKTFTLILWIIPAVSLFTAVFMYPINLGYQMNIGFYSELFMGIVFIVIGNYLPKARQNYTIGIKTPWALANEENWNRTHRLAGYLWVIGGILTLIIGLTRLVSEKWLIAIIIVMSLVPYIYSFWLHAKKKL